MPTCFQNRVYARRRDGRLLRFRNRNAFDQYRLENHETKQSLRIITRLEFIEQQRGYREPSWIVSKVNPGMCMLRDVD